MKFAPISKEGHSHQEVTKYRPRMKDLRRTAFAMQHDLWARRPSLTRRLVGPPQRLAMAALQ
jgi:hypothetical protein